MMQRVIESEGVRHDGTPELIQVQKMKVNGRVWKVGHSCAYKVREQEEEDRVGTLRAIYCANIADKDWVFIKVDQYLVTDRYLSVRIVDISQLPEHSTQYISGLNLKCLLYAAPHWSGDITLRCLLTVANA